jgi:8-oxo-dGTP diphosphatase
VKPVRVSVKAVIRRGGELLVTKEVDAEGPYYILPGGAQEPGEALDETARRECREEIGAEVEVGDLLWVRDFVHRNHPRMGDPESEVHQLEFFFRCTLLGDGQLGSGTAVDAGQVAVEWLDLRTLPARHFYPVTLRPLLAAEDPTGPVYLGDAD